MKKWLWVLLLCVPLLQAQTSTTSLIGKEDLKYWDGVTDTFQRRTSSGNQITLSKFGNEIDVLAVYGSGTSRTSASINAALSQISTSENIGLSLAPGTWAITENTTIPATRALLPVDGTVISVSSGVTLTINGGFKGVKDVFTGTGTIAFGSGAIIEFGPAELFSAAATVTIADTGEYPIEWFYNSAQAVAAIPAGSTLKIHGSWDVGTKGVISSSKPMIISGTGSGEYSGSDAGAIIINSGGDVVDSPCITFDGGATNGIRRPIVKDLTIIHEGSTSYAILLDETIYNKVENVLIDMNNLGFGGIHTTDAGAAGKGSHFTIIDRCNIKQFTDYGIHIEGSGSAHKIIDCNVSSNEDNTVGIETIKQGTVIEGGEVGLSGANAIGIYFHNEAAAAQEGGLVRDVFFENFVATGDCIKIDGDTHAASEIYIDGIRGSLSNNLGSMVNFQRATQCLVNAPQLSSITGGGTSIEWGANSNGCGAINLNGTTARGPFTVDAAATRAFVQVTESITETSMGLVDTDTNLIVHVDWQSTWKTPMLHDGTDWRKLDAYRTSTSTMTGNETMTSEDGNIWIRDPNGGARNLVIADVDFFPGECVTVINTADAAENLMFDSAGIDQAVGQNERGIFCFDGTDWYKIGIW